MMTDKEFWMLIRRALMMIIAAIEKKYAIKNGHIVEPSETDTIATWLNDK